MKSVLPVCLLLLCTLTAPVGGNEDVEITVKDTPDGIKLSCGKNYEVKSEGGERVESLKYKDENTGEYTCRPNANNTEKPTGPKIYVKFRSCDNCIELELGSLAGMIIGDVAATIVIGVAVYLIASMSRVDPVTSHKKSSDRQHLVPNEGRRVPNDLYQPLKGRQKETYDVLNRK